MIVRINKDEQYPVFTVTQGFGQPLVGGVQVDILKAQLNRWDRVQKEFSEIQDEMQAAYKVGEEWEGRFYPYQLPKGEK